MEKLNSHGLKDPTTYLVSPKFGFIINAFLPKYPYNTN